MLKYEYMIVYNGHEGLGRCSVTRYREIESYDDIEALDDVIKGLNKMQNKFIIDFRLLRVFED